MRAELAPPRRVGGHGAAMPAVSQIHRLRVWLTAHYGRVIALVTFILPTLVAAVFLFGVAADRFVSETRFIVRSVDKPASMGAAAFLQDFGIARANDDAFAIQEFIRSRDAMNALMRRIDMRAVYTAPESDAITRYRKTGADDTNEAFYRYYKRQVAVEKDEETGITTVRVSAYRARDAKAIADFLLKLSEARINQLNERARGDALTLANRSLGDAAAELANANVALTRFRGEAGLVDPAQSAEAALDRNSALGGQLAMQRATLAAMLAKAPDNPAIPAVRQRIAALEAQSSLEQGQMTGQGNSLSGRLGGFEELAVKRELAAKSYEAAEKQLESARSDVARQQVYIETIAAPSLPDEALDPRRWRDLFTVALLGFWTFLIFYLLVSGSREHLNLS